MSIQTGDRAPEIVVEGRRYVQFCSNNYLGLANDPEVIAAAREATERWGTGAGLGLARRRFWSSLRRG